MARFRIDVAQVEKGGLNCNQIVTISTTETIEKAELIADNAIKNENFIKNFGQNPDFKFDYSVDVYDTENNEFNSYQTGINE